jgi:hypothetical protein
MVHRSHIWVPKNSHDSKTMSAIATRPPISTTTVWPLRTSCSASLLLISLRPTPSL